MFSVVCSDQKLLRGSPLSYSDYKILGSGLGNDVLVGCRRRGEHLLGEAVEEQATSTLASTGSTGSQQQGFQHQGKNIYAQLRILWVRFPEHKWVRFGERRGVGPEKPAFKQTGHPMNGW